MGSPQALSLNGEGGDSGPNATLLPTSLAFGNADTDTTSSAQTITLSNYGTTTLGITGITVSANFGQTNTCNSTLRIRGELHDQRDLHARQYGELERQTLIC